MENLIFNFKKNQNSSSTSFFYVDLSIHLSHYSSLSFSFISAYLSVFRGDEMPSLHQVGRHHSLLLIMGAHQRGLLMSKYGCRLQGYEVPNLRCTMKEFQS